MNDDFKSEDESLDEMVLRASSVRSGNDGFFTPTSSPTPADAESEQAPEQAVAAPPETEVPPASLWLDTLDPRVARLPYDRYMIDLSNVQVRNIGLTHCYFFLNE